jgi:hypothetical protein
LPWVFIVKRAPKALDKGFIAGATETGVTGGSWEKRLDILPALKDGDS